VATQRPRRLQAADRGPRRHLAALYLNADRNLLLQRLADRSSRDDANAMPLTPSAPEDFIARFEEPTGEGEELAQP
jgi:hypothetical protein